MAPAPSRILSITHRDHRSIKIADCSHVLEGAGVRISMDGKGRWVGNVFVERLWRSVKYENVYLRAYRDGREARAQLSSYFDFYNRRRLHQSLNYRTPDEMYFGTPNGDLATAA